jgi:methyltransferase
MSLVQWVVLAVLLQRLAELAYARANTRRLLAAGAVEVGAGHMPLIVAVHAGWLAALFFLVPATAPVSYPLLAIYVVLQLGRLWVIVTLGPRWTVRVIALPGAPLVTDGPYRYCRHPNYAIVATEIAILPLAFGAWQIALVFSVLNGAVLMHRIRVEENALAQVRSPTGSR